VSNGPALSSSDEGDAGSCLLLGGPAGKTSATNAPLTGSNLGQRQAPRALPKTVIGLEIRGEFKNLTARLVNVGIEGAISSAINRTRVTPSTYSNATQNFATKVALHQRDLRPSGFLIGSMLPPGVAPGSPVKTKQSSFVRLVS
jgi:hypothetical protein